jgi:glycosyltransferase involved in cell wall biosynthesis
MAKVSVLIPAKNAEATVAQTLESLCAQTFKDFDVVLVDDGSTDLTAAEVDRFSDRLSLKMISLDNSVGVAKALNTGIEAIGSEYIARLDSDDTAMPDRLARQVQFMDQSPEVDVCGSTVEMFWDDDSQPARHLVKPALDAEIRTALVQYCSLSHPSVMVRRTFFDRVGRYNPDFDFAEDYELWCRGALQGARYANLLEPLTRYRQHNRRVSVEKQAIQSQRALDIQRNYIAALLGEPPGLLPELLSLGLRFKERDLYETVLRQEMYRAMKLFVAVPDGKHYSSALAQILAVKSVGY